MTLDEAIKEEKNFAEKTYKSANFHHTNKSVHMEGVCRELAEYHEQVAKWLEELQKLKKESEKDCISRQAVDELSKELVHTTRDKADFLCNFWEKLQKLPPVTPQLKTKRCKWIRYDYRTICPQNHDVDNPYWRIPEKRMDVLKYCPYCGKEVEVTE